VLSQQQLVELARTFLAQAAKTPGMVAGRKPAGFRPSWAA
jgi:hypothetical protein